MSYFDDASLVFIPSGTKTSKAYSVKPIDGTGDLTFSRSNDTATRVNSAGLIEKVRTNLVLQSNTFSTTWVNTNSTETGGQAGYDGTNNAWLLTASSAGGFIYQDVTIAGLVTFSIYAKAGSEIGITLYSAHASQGRYFNLSTGALGGTFVGAPLDSKIESIGSGWYRCSITVSATATNNFRVYVSNGTANVTGNILIQNAQVETGDIATDPILTTSAAVSVGPVANVPRLDYLNSTCPKLILEPQRSNLAQFSEQANNAAWSKNGVTVTANAATSPDGYTNADKIVETATTGPHGLAPTYSIANSTTYTFSIFAKKAENDYVIMNIYTGAVSTFTSFNVANGTIGTTGAGATAKIENYGNGWYRCSLTATTAATGSPNIFMWTARANDAIEYAGNGVNGTFIYGCQLEAGAYATSYIPTLGAAVTRGADQAEKASISSLIGATEGTMFVDILFTGAADNNPAYIQTWASQSERLGLFYSSSSNIIRPYLVTSSGSADFSLGFTPTAGTRYKMAFCYKANDYAFFEWGASNNRCKSNSTDCGNEIICRMFGFCGSSKPPIFKH